MGVATRTVPAAEVPPRPPADALASAVSAGDVRVWRPSRESFAVFLVGLAVTGALALTSHAVYERNESRLLGLRVRELGLVLTGSVPSIQTPLASAAELADATDGSAQRFRTFIAPYVGTRPPVRVGVALAAGNRASCPERRGRRRSGPGHAPTAGGPILCPCRANIAAERHRHPRIGQPAPRV